MEAETIALTIAIAGVLTGLLGLNLNALRRLVHEMGGLRNDIRHTDRCNMRMKRQMLLLRGCIIMKWGDEPKVVEMLNDEWHEIDKGN